MERGDAIDNRAGNQRDGGCGGYDPSKFVTLHEEADQRWKSEEQNQQVIDAMVDGQHSDTCDGGQGGEHLSGGFGASPGSDDERYEQRRKQQPGEEVVRGWIFCDQHPRRLRVDDVWSKLSGGGRIVHSARLLARGDVFAELRSPVSGGSGQADPCHANHEQCDGNDGRFQRRPAKDRAQYQVQENDAGELWLQSHADAEANDTRNGVAATNETPQSNHGQTHSYE